MKKSTLLLIIICGLFAGCSRTVEEPVDARDAIVKALTGTGNKHWMLKELYINNIAQTLTDYQRAYWLDFTTTSAYMGTFADRDGNEGKWRVPNTQEIPCVYTNTARVPKNYVINFISSTQLDIEYTANLVTAREVYYAN